MEVLGVCAAHKLAFMGTAINARHPTFALIGGVDLQYQYFQHAHIIPTVGVEKRGAHQLIHGGLQT